MSWNLQKLQFTPILELIPEFVTLQKMPIFEFFFSRGTAY